MAQFMAEIQGQSGMTSRLGNKNSGIWGHIRGWNIGIRVDGVHDDGEDKFYVYATSGSTGSRSDVLICILTERDITLMSQREIRDGIGYKPHIKARIGEGQAV